MSATDKLSSRRQPITPATAAAAATGGVTDHRAEIANARAEIKGHLMGIAAREEDIAGRRRTIARWEQRIRDRGGEVEAALASPPPSGAALPTVGKANARSPDDKTLQNMMLSARSWCISRLGVSLDFFQARGLVARVLTGMDDPGHKCDAALDAALARLAQPSAGGVTISAAAPPSVTIPDAPSQDFSGVRADDGAVREAALSAREIAQEIVLNVLADEHQDRVDVFANYRSEIDRAETLIRAALAAPGTWAPDFTPSSPSDASEVR